MTRTALMLFLAMLLAATPVAAKDGGDDGGGDSGGNSGNGSDSNGGSSNEDDYDDDDSGRARSGVSSGAILPLSTILSGIEARYGARMIDAELGQRRGRMIYELEMITPAGRVLDVEVDAATARVIRVDD